MWKRQWLQLKKHLRRESGARWTPETEANYSISTCILYLNTAVTHRFLSFLCFCVELVIVWKTYLPNYLCSDHTGKKVMKMSFLIDQTVLSLSTNEFDKDDYRKEIYNYMWWTMIICNTVSAVINILVKFHNCNSECVFFSDSLIWWSSIRKSWPLLRA